ncbi:hypothetical protein [Microbacterium paraoxydans]|jgi:hypothetical protein|uniref:hypothetical protein n=1 Tax=Microbacterium paraoxydans TaxID=199592 RepID=UPI0004A7FCED|nr:hypothetical protein [Microbacterium paraoxydans]
MCYPEGSFACFTDADWWAFFVNVAVALGTLAAVGVAVVESVRSGIRAKVADRRAADAAAEAAALEQVQAQVQARATLGATDARRLRLEAEIAKNEHWLRVAEEYSDVIRAASLDATLAELRSELASLPPVQS